MAAIRKYLPKTARRAIKARERARIIKKPLLFKFI